MVPSQDSNARRILEVIPIRAIDLPNIDFFLDKKTVAVYKYKKTWETGKKDPCWILYTSRSSGNLKPIFRYLDSATLTEANNLLPLTNG
jgi:hypothetical protein